MTFIETIETLQLTAANFKIGSLTTPAGSEVTVEFPSPFTAGSYSIFFTSAGDNGAAGSINAYISGLARASGCEVIGAPLADYNYLAVGV